MEVPVGAGAPYSVSGNSHGVRYRDRIARIRRGGRKECYVVTTNISRQKHKSCMTREDAARFLQDNWVLLRNSLLQWGCPEDVEDALGEVFCKILGTPIGNGTVLKWKDDPFGDARTRAEWFGLFRSQARARLTNVQFTRSYWIDPDPCDVEFADADFDADGMEEREKIYVETVTGVAPCTADDEADDADEGRGPGAEWRRQRAARKQRIRSFAQYEESRHAANYMPRPGICMDAEIRDRAAWAMFRDVCREHNVSPRDTEAYVRVYLLDEPSAAVSKQLGIKPNNLYQIKARILRKLAAYGGELFRRHRDRMFAEAS